MNGSAGVVVTVTLTGVSRSGKGRLARALGEWCNKAGAPCRIVEQDEHWLGRFPYVLPDGREVQSEEEPCSTDWDRMLNSTKEEMEFVSRTCPEGSFGVVIVEGYSVLDNVALLDFLVTHGPVVWLEVAKDEAIRRRSSPGPHNPEAREVWWCREVVWPAHERYVRRVTPHLPKDLIKIDSSDQNGDPSLHFGVVREGIRAYIYSHFDEKAQAAIDHACTV